MATYKVGDILYEFVIEPGCAPAYLAQKYYVKKIFDENKIEIIGLMDNYPRFESKAVLDNLFRKVPIRR